MIRSLIFLVKIAFVILTIILVTSYPGTVIIQWETYTLETSTAILVLSILFMMGAFYLFGDFSRRLKGSSSGLSRLFRMRTAASIEHSMKKSLEACKTKNQDQLMNELKTLSHLVTDPVLKLYFQGKIAHLTQSPSSENHFKDLLNFQEGKLLGHLELTSLALLEKDYEKALFHAENAFKAHKKSPWVIKILLKLYLLQSRYKEAEKILRYGESGEVFSWEEVRSIQAGIWYEKAQKEEGDRFEQTRLLKKAIDWSPGLIPALKLLGESHDKSHKTNQISEIIEAAWALTPHPDLQDLYLSSCEDSLQKAQRMEKLHLKNPHHPTSIEQTANLFLKANLWGKAREYLGKIPKETLSVTACKLWADLELAEYQDVKKAQAWYDAMTTARPSNHWVCHKCLQNFEEWTLLCPHCLSVHSINYGS